MDVTSTGMTNFRNTAVDTALSAGVRGTSSGDDEKLREATRDFESLFIKQMLSSMRKTVSKSGLLDGGMAQEIFEDMLYDEYAKSMSRTANFGISDMMFRQLSTARPEI